MTVIDLVHDIQIFINLWESEYAKMKVKQDYLYSKYDVTPCYDIDDEYKFVEHVALSRKV